MRRPVRRVVVSVLVAALLAAAGAAGGAAFHRYEVQPSDDELVAQAREIEVPGLVADGEPAVVGRFTPTLTRGSGLLDATADAGLDGAAGATALEAQGWGGVEVTTSKRSQVVTASRGAVELYVRVWLEPQRGAEVTVELTRGDASPSLVVTVLLGAGLGAAVGALLAVLVARRQRGPQPSGRSHSESRTAYR